MSTTHVHMFVVPAGHLDELHELERRADEARQQDQRDRYYRHNQLLLRAAQPAVASVVLEQEKYGDPAGSLWIWMNERFRGGKDSNVVDAGEFEAIRSGLSGPRRDDLMQWADEHMDGYGDVDRAVLVEIFDAVVAMVGSVPPGPHGLVYGYFFERHREPPAPRPALGPRRPISEQENQWLKQSWERRMRRLSVRAHADYWPEEEGTEGRYVLGLLSPERVAVLRPFYLRAWRVMFEQGHTEGHALLGEWMQELEHALEQPCMVTRAALVNAHSWFNVLVEWNKPEHRGVATPEMAYDLSQRLDALQAEHGGLEGLIERVWDEERHWSRDDVRDAYAQVRDLAVRAQERGYGFVWHHDRDW